MLLKHSGNPIYWELYERGARHLVVIRDTRGELRIVPFS